MLQRARLIARHVCRAKSQLLVGENSGGASCRAWSGGASSSPAGKLTENPAFVFDIDGVLIRGHTVLPAAQEAMQQYLCRGGVWRHAVCFLTNGGGVTEAHKAKQLSEWLGVPVSPQQVILSHTPMRALARRFAEQVVLVSGRGDCAAVARHYGFQRVLTVDQLAAAMPSALPFQHHGLPAARSGSSPASEPCPVLDLGWSTEAAPIQAVLVMNDPSDWYQDLQLLADVITAHGVPLRGSPLPGSKPVEVYFSNPDLLWAASHPRPRFGQGAFAAALDALHRQLTGSSLPCARFFGKPNPQPYRLAERLLLSQASTLGLWAEPAQAEHGKGAAPSAASVFSDIYMVGDNPAADIRGANLAGPPWRSVLVRTGVFAGGANSPSDPAHAVVEDVLAAVKAGLHRAGHKAGAAQS